MSISSPPGYGRPDYLAPSANLMSLVEYFNGTYTNVHSTPLVPTAAWQGAEVLWVPNSLSGFLELQWWDDANQSTLIENTQYPSATGNQVIGPLTLPHIGPYFNATITHYPNPGPGTAEQLWVYQTGRMPICPVFPISDNVVTGAGLTAPASGSLAVVTNFSWAGPARLWITSAEAITWNLQVANVYGNFITIDGSTAAATMFSVPIVCPISEWQILITNTTATASLFDCYVTPSITGAM